MSAEETRRRLLEAAGQVFAERGFERATGKEICHLARTNAAAINYHFDGKAGLYAATLIEAHRRLLPLEAMTGLVAGARNPVAQLRAVIDLITGALVGPLSRSWVLRVLSREMLSPSDAIDALREQELVPKARVLRGVVGALMQLPDDHPAVSRACINILAPPIFLLIGPRQTMARAFPGLRFTPDDAPALSRHLLRYALGGLAAVARDAKAR